jgi:small subunit ribosomal protein S17
MIRRRKEFIGRVVSDKMNKTVVVVLDRQFTHQQFQKVIRRRAKFKAHDERNQCKIGDRVKIIETRPLSKDKRWAVIEVVERAEAPSPALSAESPGG